MQDKQRFDKVLESFEQELQSVDKDPGQLVCAADYLGAMLPARRRRRTYVDADIGKPYAMKVSKYEMHTFPVPSLLIA